MYQTDFLCTYKHSLKDNDNNNDRDQDQDHDSDEITGYEIDELYKADEAFVTSSVIEIMPLVEVDGRPVGSGSVGSITNRLMRQYKALVSKELDL